MKLSHRLKAIKECVLKGSVLADIGCDHAYLSCACVLEGICCKAYASDLNIGPLQSAKKNIEELQLTDRVFPILSNGLHEIPDDCEVVVISGMGFETIKLILENDFERLKNFKQIIIQSNSDLELLRAWISEHQYHIADERIVYDGHYYQILVIEPVLNRPLSEHELYFGVHLKKEPLFHAYYQLQRDKYLQILGQLATNHPKYDEISRQIEQINEQIKTSS